MTPDASSDAHPIPARALEHESDSIYDRGLEFDVRTLVRRRAALTLFGGAGLAALAACSSDPASTNSSTSASATAASPTAGSSATPSAEVPDETAGPYPGDGSNGPDVLAQSGVVRSDIATNLGSSERVPGIPLTINLTVTDASAGYAALTGAAVYAWHCDAQGRYSMYSDGVTDQTFLRGVVETDAQGTATFTSVFPGCYAGRWPHIHFEVYAGLDAATSSGQIVKTSQIALPHAVCEQVYADSSTYPSSASNLGQLSLTSDNVFGEDGGVLQLATVTGSAAQGYIANLTIGV
ncbi:MAG: intradiol ring-cleavage dioxygenase [Tetrasphaera sp.]|nr:intradiol ring-cleavage dioxygenase [Tetrasphaera sp.]